MKKKQGFTLIELLAVIVILAVIALITTPLILGVIEKAKKGALEDTAYGLIDSANIYFAEGILDESQSKTEFTFEDGKQTSEKKLSYKGKVEKGSLRLFSDGKNALCISDGNNSAVKNVNDKKVKVVTGRCTYNSETDEYETVGLCQDLQDELDELKKKQQEELDQLKKEYESKAAQLAKDHADQIKALEETYQDQIDALNQKITELEATHQAALDQLKKDYEAQIKTIKEAYEAQIAELNRQLNIFKTGGTASVSQILAGQTAFVKGTLLTGTMPNRGAVNSTLNAGGSYTIPVGYHNGTGKVTVNTLASQTSATATVAQILSGQTAWVNGNKITGTMKNNGAVNSTLNAGGSYTIPAGYHNGSGKVTGNTLASQTSGTATVAQILAGQTAWVNGNKITGTMKNNGTINQTIKGGGSYNIPAGYASGGAVRVSHVIKSWCPNYGSWTGLNDIITTDTYSVNATFLYVLVRSENGGTVYHRGEASSSNGTVKLLIDNGAGVLYAVNKEASATFTLNVGIRRNYGSEPNATLRVYAFTTD